MYYFLSIFAFCFGLLIIIGVFKTKVKNPTGSLVDDEVIRKRKGEAIGVAIFLLIAGYCIWPGTEKNETVENTEPNSAVLNTTPNTVVDDTSKTVQISAVEWKYRDEENKITSGNNHFAEVQALNLLSFKFPYEGGSVAKLNIRNKEGKNAVFLKIDPGQFLDGAGVRIRFDDNKPLYYSGYTSSDGDATILFLASPDQVIYHLKRSKSVVIEAAFYQAGRQTMEFNTDSLNWNYKLRNN